MPDMLATAAPAAAAAPPAATAAAAAAGVRAEACGLLSSTFTIEAQAQVSRQPSSTAVSLPASLACQQ
jgi:hypothetical protein